MKEKMKKPTQQLQNVWGIVTLTTLATAVIVGGGVYFWQSSTTVKMQSEFYDLRRQVSELQSQLSRIENEKAKIEAEKLELEREYCKGTWKNGICIQKACVDSDVNEKPNDIYIKGSVTFTDENGIATTVYDECSGPKTQVNEMWCYESPKGSGNYVQGRMVYDCPKGCLDGACIK